jgi:hypothetical protein
MFVEGPSPSTNIRSRIPLHPSLSTVDGASIEGEGDIVGVYGGSGGSVGELVNGTDGDGKMSLDEGNSRCSYDQEGDGPNITNFPTEPDIGEYLMLKALDERLNLGRIGVRNVIARRHPRLPRAQSRPSANISQVRIRSNSLCHAVPPQGDGEGP